MKRRINVTKTFLPSFEEYSSLLKPTWKSRVITNHGPLVTELESRLKDYLNVKYTSVINNATIGLQIATKVLVDDGEIITTPFTYIATTSSIIWQHCKPVFVDIRPDTFSIDADKIEEAITKKTKAILAVHVYGFPCEVEKINKIAKKYNLKVIYDAAHAFGVKYKGKSLLNWGDISILSFHATKLFHTVEGGALFARNKVVMHKISYSRNFGHKGYDTEFYGVGINGKMSEFHAAMGLSLLPYIDQLIEMRKNVTERYNKSLAGISVNLPMIPKNVIYNYAYYPIVFKNESALLKVKRALNRGNIFPRRYFYPSLNTVKYITDRFGKNDCPISESISTRVLCLPLYPDLGRNSQKQITDIIRNTL